MSHIRGFSALTAILSFLAISEVFAIPHGNWNQTTVSVSLAQSSPSPSVSIPFNTSTQTPSISNTSNALDPNAVDCFITLPDNALSAAGLATPILLMPPCSMSVGTQQAFAEAAVIDSNGQISIYHPLIIDAGTQPAAAPVVPDLPAGASVALWFGFNGATLQLLDKKGQDANHSPTLQNMKCVVGLPGVDGDIFGQVSWCNTDAFFSVANAAIASGKTQIPPLGTDKNGKDCPSSRSFTVVDQDMSDNLPTKYLLLSDGTLAQDTASNRAQFPQAVEIDNASDEALIGDIIDPLIGCTPFQVPSLDDPGSVVSSLATQELQAGVYQKAPVALVPLNDPDCILTSDGTSQSTAKVNAYRIGVNQPLLGNGPNTDDGSPSAYCSNLIIETPPFLLQNQDAFANAASPDTGIGNNLFTFLCNRFLQSLTNLICTETQNFVNCQLDSNGAATSCTITGINGTTTGGGAGGGAGGGPSSASTSATGHSRQHHTQSTTTASTNSFSFVPPPSSQSPPPGGNVLPPPFTMTPPGPQSSAGFPSSVAGPDTAATSQTPPPGFTPTSFGPTATATFPDTPPPGFTPTSFGPTATATFPDTPPTPPGNPPAGDQTTIVTMTTLETVTVTANVACTATGWHQWGSIEWRYIEI